MRQPSPLHHLWGLWGQRLRRLKLRVGCYSTYKKPRGGFKGASCFYSGENLKKIISREETGWWLTMDHGCSSFWSFCGWHYKPCLTDRFPGKVHQSPFSQLDALGSITQFFLNVQCCCWWTTSQETVDVSNVSAVVLLYSHWFDEFDWNPNWRRILSIKQYHGRSF